MSDYTERFERNTKGLEFLSFGVSPSCAQCADSLGFRDEEDEDGETVKTALESLAAYEAGRAEDEGGFSWSPCGLCDSRLGGDRFIYHYAIDGRIRHDADGCADCLIYVSNGEEPSE